MLENIRKFPQMLLFEPEVVGRIPEFSGGRMLIFGMGGSAAAGDLFTDWSGLDVRVIRGYDVPEYVGDDDYFVAVSYSGNTEETLSAYSGAVKRGLKGFVITTGGKLMERAMADGLGVVRVPEGYQPREAFGYLLRALVAGTHIAGILNEEAFGEFQDVASRMKGHLGELSTQEGRPYEVASALYRRLPFIYSDSAIFSVAIRWKNQINENANSFAHAMAFPEHNHNEIEGFEYPELLETRAWLLFLKTDYDHPKVKLRMELVEDILRDFVIGSESIQAKGDSRLEQILYLVWFGDFVSYWLAVQYGTDPYRIDRIRRLKKLLSKDAF
ncbi:MAG: bifunctional phosphoglucose/phosphomannose isomerase [Thermotogae bacterium]|nr:bifunctional phosphoglucose/phosphomannose isomerase [Thermotogota bacterium]